MDDTLKPTNDAMPTSWHQEVNFKSPRLVAENKLTDLVTVITKSYPNVLRHAGAHIETFVLSRDERVCSSQHVHEPFKYAAAKRNHNAIVQRCRAKLGLVPEVDPELEPCKADTPSMLAGSVILK